MSGTGTAAAAGAQVEVWLDAELTQALDRHAREHGPSMSRPEVLREIVRAWARDKGYLPDGEGIRPEDLNSANDG